MTLMKLHIWIIIVFLFITSATTAQDVINGYAEVTNIVGTTVTLGETDESAASFEVGDNVLIMQMQDDIIGANTGANTTFGDVQTIGSAGLYEEVEITSVTRAGSVTAWTEDFENTAAIKGATGCVTGGCRAPFIQAYGGSNYMAAENTNGYSMWYSDLIDISTYDHVDLTMFAAQYGFDNSDHIYLIYDIDESGDFQTYQDLTGNFGWTNYGTTGIKGSSVRIYVVYLAAAGHYGAVDNISVTGHYGASSVTLSKTLDNSYSVGSATSVQMVSFPKYTNYTTTSDLTAKAWNGTIGGVFALDITNTLTLQNNISVNGQGFLGGNPSAENWDGCNATVYRADADGYGQKGQGAHKLTNNTYRAARGKIANGGGGGNPHNAGGAGEGNYTVGGNGGPGYDGSAGGCSASAGGIGGVDLSDFISAQRIYLGGGGGGGHQNNAIGSAGGNGGGMIIIRANEIATGGTCGGGKSITANGVSAADTGNDGSGGGGAGGSILFQVQNWSLATCTLNVTATGGAGGSVNDATTHAGGGGGGKGVIIFSGTVPGTNLNTDVSQGSGGSNNNTGGGSTADGGGNSASNPAADPDGIIESEEGPLPVDLLYWKGADKGNYNQLNWKTATETDNHYFTIDRSFDGETWETVAFVEGHGTTNMPLEYQFDDQINGRGLVYYRLQQTDFDGTTEVFDVIVIENLEDNVNLLLYPNPSDGYFTLQSSGSLDGAKWKLMDLNGKDVAVDVIEKDGKILFDMNNKASGHYLLRVAQGNKTEIFKVIVR